VFDLSWYEGKQKMRKLIHST